MRFIFAALSLASMLFSSYAAAKPDDRRPRIAVLASVRLVDGGCAFQLQMTNPTNQTLQVTAHAYLANSDGIMLADDFIGWPPTLPNGTSLTQAVYQTNYIAGGRCTFPAELIVTTASCYVTGESSRLRDSYCVRTERFSQPTAGLLRAP